MQSFEWAPSSKSVFLVQIQIEALDRSGLLSDVTDRWKLMLSGTYLRYALGDKSEDIRWFVGSRYTLSQDWALRVEYNHRDRDNDVVFSIQAFF